MPSLTVEDLKKIIALSDLPDEHLQWILDRSEYTEYEDGTQIKKTGDEADVMIITLEGKISFYHDYHGRLVYYFYYTNDETTGGVGGLFPYSRMKVYPGCSFAVGQVRCLKLHKKYFPELELLNPEFIQRLIGYMTERAKVVATMQSQQEKVNALGQLAAGIAHELNNPAAAINRIADELDKRLTRTYELTKKLLYCNITPEHIQHIHTLVAEKEKTAAQKAKLTTLRRMEYEDELAEWLEEKGVTEREIAETFSETRFSTEELESIRDDLGSEAFILVLPWLENLLSTHKIIKDLNDASTRISHLVGSIKSHVQMDRGSDLQPTNIHEDIDNTLTLLGFKLRAKNIEIRKKYCTDLPVVPAYVGELNQVWTNLIDNAIGALDRDGVLTIETSCDPKNVTVSIMDNGAGIPADILSRIFDPFFTTKKVGEGTGIGLDIVKRVVKRHKGEIKVTSVPGRTEFLVSLPIIQQEAK
ncbi:GHKL domain-containing protein [Ilyomonas limi]|uniref:histidine kinase n=1 Tax=Ilyomonas limi TaxID=2575867 RepID=A0A4V5UV79_9BACT|nr:ATP-binding protein [Ilyomonas limi]TKK72043.1 GHKL domain-containing protein [Ilyomonas limi]